jgi:hypothetical protein
MDWNKISPFTNITNFPTDYGKFKESTEKFIRDKFNKKDNKKMKSGNLSHLDTTISNETIHYVKDIEFLLDVDGYNSIVQTLSAGCEYNPILTFHSTQNVNKLNSIVKYGYLLPGEIHPTKAYSLLMHTGNLYGDGIYSSPSFKCSTNYTFLDLNNDTKVIVNLLIMTKVKYVDPHDTKSKSQIPNLSYGETKYDDGSTVLINQKYNIFVTCNKKYIIPIMLLTTSDNFVKNKISQLAKIKNFSWLDLAKRIDTKTQYNIKMYKLFNDYYVISSDSNTLTVKKECRHLFVFPIEYLSKNELKKSFINFVNSFPNTHVKILILYDTKAYVHPITNSTLETLIIVFKQI